MLTEMSEVHGLESNRFCFSAVIKALAKGGQWKRALEKIDEMLALGLSPDPVVYTAAIGACERVRAARTIDCYTYQPLFEFSTLLLIFPHFQ